MTLSDHEFVKQFEAQTLDSVHFNHIGHLRLCWLYLQEYELETAVAKTCAGIQSYAESLAANDKFHHTITEFLVRLIRLRIQSQADDSFDDFLGNNKDLVDDAQHLLSRYYSKPLLHSPAARLSYVQPDLLQLAS